MSDRKNRFGLFKKHSKPTVFFKLRNFRDKNQIKSDSNDVNKKSGKGNGDYSSFASFESIIPENSPLKKNSNLESGFYNDELSGNHNINGSNSHFDNGLNTAHNSPDCDLGNALDGVDEKYAKYIFSEDSNYQNGLSDSNNYGGYNFNNGSKDSDSFGGLYDSNNLNHSENLFSSNNLNHSKDVYDSNDLNHSKDVYESIGVENGRVKGLLNFKKKLLNQNNSSKNLFGKITILLIFLVLISSIFYFFVYQPFQDELNLERNSKLNELNALYKGPLELNDDHYTLENQINQAYDVEELKSIDILRFATKDWKLYHSSKIVSCKDDFGRVMMSYGDNKNLIMSVKDANDFVKDNDAKILSNVQFEKVNTVIVPVSISRLQATAGLISVGSVVDIYSLNDNSSGYDYSMESNGDGLENGQDNEYGMESNDSNQDISNETIGTDMDEGYTGTADIDEGYGKGLETVGEGPLVSGATVLAILRSKDSGLVDNAVSKSNTIIEGNETNPFENTSSFSADVEELLKSAVLNSSNDENALDAYLTNYGVRLSNFERMSNLGDLDSNYLVLLEVPQSDVNFVINNMDNLILTIPTDFAPNWVLTELNETYYENLYQNQPLEIF